MQVWLSGTPQKQQYHTPSVQRGSLAENKKPLVASREIGLNNSTTPTRPNVRPNSRGYVHTSGPQDPSNRQ